MASAGVTLLQPAWRTWSGLATARPAQVLMPADSTQVVEAVRSARARGLRVKMVGTGHSFTDIAVTDGLLLRPDGLVGISSVDRRAMTVTALAGTPLHVLNERLHGLGLALHNMGDIDAQTVAGAISTGTHGTGGRQASLSAQVAALDVVTGDGTLVRARPDGTPEEATLFEAARVGLGALGIVTAVTFAVEPAFALRAVEAPMSWAEVVDGFADHVAANQHFEAFWFPHTDRMLTKRNNRHHGAARPLSRLRQYVDDELLSNRLFSAVNRVGNVAPGTIRGLNRLSSVALGARTFSDDSHRVFPSSRRVVFREMEYAVPMAAGMQVLTEVRGLVERRGWRISFPVEIRHAPPDDVWLATAYERESVHLGFHVNARTDHRAYFAGVEEVCRAHDGRPHWGKLHTRTAADLAPAYPRFGDFVALRDRVDPDRLFANAYLERVLPA
jgi:L-gulono-1,4-lactone dehydrogenase